MHQPKGHAAAHRDDESAVRTINRRLLVLYGGGQRGQECWATRQCACLRMLSTAAEAAFHTS